MYHCRHLALAYLILPYLGLGGRSEGEPPYSQRDQDCARHLIKSSSTTPAVVTAKLLTVGFLVNPSHCQSTMVSCLLASLISLLTSLKESTGYKSIADRLQVSLHNDVVANLPIRQS